MNDYLRRVERLETQLNPRICDKPCVKCVVGSLGKGDPRDLCDKHPQTLDELLGDLARRAASAQQSEA